MSQHQAPAAQQQRHSRETHGNGNPGKSQESPNTAKHHRAQTLEVQQIQQSKSACVNEHTCDAPTSLAVVTNGDLGEKGDEEACDSDEARGSKKQDYTVEGEAREPRPRGGIKQRRREKRKAGWERKKQLVKETKKMKRQGREEAMRKAGVEIPADGKLWRDLPPEQWSVSQKIRWAKRKEFEELAHSGGYRVCLDMAFDDLMPEKARASMVQQVLYLYGSNKKAKQPCLVTLSGMGPLMTTAIHRLSGFDTWLGTTTDSRCYTEMFKKEDLVYLTADSPYTITEMERGKVYIIGGIVDRNAHKGLCFKKATEQGIATARLPLKQEDLNSSTSKVLATNHVFDILLRAMESGGDLQRIDHQTLPPRKRAGWTGSSNREPRRIAPENQGTSGAKAGEPRAKEAGLAGRGSQIEGTGALRHNSSEGKGDTGVEQGENEGGNGKVKRKGLVLVDQEK